MHSTSRTRALGALLLGLALAPTPARGLPLLSEVFYDAAGSDDGKSFVELFAAPGSSLDGFTLEGVNGANGAIAPSLALSGSIPEDGLFLLADDAGDGTTLAPGADLVLNFDFQNGPDSIVLRNAEGVVDAVGYGWGCFDLGDVCAHAVHLLGARHAERGEGWSDARISRRVDHPQRAHATSCHRSE